MKAYSTAETGDAALISEVKSAALATASKIVGTENVEEALNQCPFIKKPDLYLAHCERVFDYNTTVRARLQKKQTPVLEAMVAVCKMRGYEESEWNDYSMVDEPFLVMQQLGSLLLKEHFPIIVLEGCGSEERMRKIVQSKGVPLAWIILGQQSYALFIEGHLVYTASDLEAFFIFHSSFSVLRMRWSSRICNDIEVKKALPTSASHELFHRLVITSRVQRASTKMPKKVSDTLMDIFTQMAESMCQK